MNHPTFADRQAGVCLHLTSLPGDYGVGDIGVAARVFIDAVSSMNLGVWQILPNGPTGYGNSPYQSLSSFAGNELLIDIESLIQLGLIEPDEAMALGELPRDTVDYAGLIPLKNALLTTAADRFRARASALLRADFEQFVHRNDKLWLNDYALFRAIKTRHSEKAWTDWDPALAHRDNAALKKFEAHAERQLTGVKVLQFIFYWQWHALRQYAREKNVRLFGDMPLYVALDSADVWANPDLVGIDQDGRLEHVAGVPPDYFSEDGQLWGNPLYDWEYHAATGYAWWTERIRHAVAQVEILRIDHFRGLESYWAVPAMAETARDGEWRRGPGAVFLEALRGSLGDLPIVAENLGVITPAVETLREHYRIPGMKVLQFEVVESDFDPGDIAEGCVLYTGTHDNDTIVGWFHGSGEDTRTPEEVANTQRIALALTNGTAQTIHTDMIRLAFASEATLAIAPMQDFLGLGSESRLNVPGTEGNNWRWRLLPDQLTPGMIHSVRELVDSSGRRVRS